MKKIVLLCSSDESSAAVYNRINPHFPIEAIIEEDSIPRKKIIVRRAKKMGVKKVMGQIAFTLFIRPFLKFESRKRREKIIEEYSLNLSQSYRYHNNFFHVNSVNSESCKDILIKINPDIVIVNGTRIISKKILDSVHSTFINMHMGITPKYRGSHGAYWAYYNNDSEHAGVTIHLVDTGIDTGGILYQETIKRTKEDNFETYPLLQAAVGIELELKAIKDITNNNLKTVRSNLPSGLYNHPTFFEYLSKRIKYHVK